MERGINYFDMAVSEAAAFDYYRAAFARCRDKVCLQTHFGADYSSGKYGWTTDPDRVKGGMDWLLAELDTDYIDFGMIHCIDETSDLETYINSGVLTLIQNLKAQGVVRHIGLSSHTPAIVNSLLDMGILDVVMFSVNPAYDYRQGDYAIGGGQLLNAALSPFQQALTEAQCIQYALDKPGVITVLSGYRNRADLERALTWLDAAPDERDYSVLGSFIPAEAEGKCVYCAHCHPCPAGLDIALINKYYDLARLGDILAADHYRKLELHAGDCIRCGHCDSRCPFHVRQSARMDEIAAYFEKRPL